MSAQLPIAPNQYTGFEIRAALYGRRIFITLEGQLPDGSWQEFLKETATIEPNFLPLWLGTRKWDELLSFQTPTRALYAGRPLRPEILPKPRAGKSSLQLAIVTPSYNQAAFLTETMRSVLDQEDVDCHYIVQDGGSTDRSREVIEKIAAELNSDTRVGRRLVRLVAWESTKDDGQADAIANGFAKTDGGPDDLMAWINSDDLLLPGSLAFVTDYFAAHPEVDAVYGNRIVVDETSKEIARWYLPRHDPEVLRFYDFVPQETLIWRRRIWNMVGGIDRSLKFAMDWDLLLRFARAGGVIKHLPYFLGCFRIHDGQKTAAAMRHSGQAEIDALRLQSFGREISAAELENNPILHRYLQRSALIQFLAKFGLRLP